ncbi:RHS repeat domain-containing protein [Phytohabitans sp. LJ34]|uniref:RHS repeat domain-containing protein n=1 Tax=Phytohabitans sp. LJ34 TaxID=3452217 RepID=UPI003F894219
MLRRNPLIAGLVALVVGISLTAGSPPSASAAPDPGPAAPGLDWRAAAADARSGEPGSPPVKATGSAPLVRSRPGTAPTATALPAPGASEVSLTARATRAGTSPVALSAKSAAAAGRRLRVEVLDHKLAARAGVSGFAFRVSGPGGAALGAGALPVEVSVDYSSFAERYGGGYADRLRVVALPACAVAAKAPRGCARGGTAVPSRNLRDQRRLVADVRDLTALAADAPVLAVTAAPEGEEGSFKATPLELSGDWQVRTGSGEFTYRYDIPIAEAPSGPTPEVRLNYSSGAVDGMVSGRNTQPGPNGLGWSDFADSFVERRYTSCLDDGQVYADLCWKSDNATISLNGKASELVPVPGSSPKQWRMRDDQRWKVEQLTGAPNGDNDGEYWKVTTPDGVRYFFGRGENPDVGVETNSAWTVPVFGDDAGEPCSTVTPVSWCSQAWRWNLDLVIDPNENVQQFEYEKEINHYSALNGWPGFEHTEYVRSGVLKMIKYGKRRAPLSATEPSAEVKFDTGFRCLALDHTCQEPTAATASDFPDTPVDLMCFAAPCAEHTPTFFTALRYSEVVASVNDGDRFIDVDKFRLAHGLPDPDPGRTGDQKLFLTAVQRTGLTAASALTMPETTFSPVRLDNRIDTGGGLSAMPHYRVGVVTNEYGGQTTVTYGRPHPCPSPLPDPPNWHLNTRNCFPHWHKPEGGAGGFAVFHKYLVTRIDERDPLGGGTPMVTEYRYGDQVAAGLPNGAWHHDRDEFVPNSVQSWSEWRGYQDALVSQGSTRTRFRMYRGMHRDRLAGDPFPGPGSRVATISSIDGTVANVPDENWLAGGVLDKVSLRADGTVESGVVQGFHAHRTVDVTATPDPLDDAWFVVPNDRVDRRRNPADGGYLRRRTQTVVNGLLGTPDQLVEHGWTNVSGDERCTRTVPAFNTDLWLLDFPASVTRYANATCTGAEVKRTEYAYDGGAFGGAPTKGNQTGKRDKITAAPTWAATTTTFDALGRPLTVTDPNGHTMTTTYTPAIRYPETTTVKNHLGHTKRTDWFVLRRAPGVETDARGKKTTHTYDALGRSLTVRRPTEQAAGAPASFQFSYDIAMDKSRVPVVRTRQLLDSAGGSPRYVDGWVVYDTMLRERQTHKQSPEAGKVLVSETVYDDRGLVSVVSPPQAVAGAPGSGILPAPAGGWANDTLTAYDELRRPVWEIHRAGGAYRWSVATEYTHDTIRKTPDPPTGGVVRTVKDAHDRIVRAEELDGASWRTTAYGYDAADRLTTVRDQAGNTITNTYDMAGRKVGVADPDMGTWSYAFDGVGNEIRSTNAAGVQLHTRYDALDRKTERRRDSASGPLLARWEYDAPGEEGLLNRSTRFDASGDWVVDVAGYDDRSRETGRTWTVPAGITGLSGGYTVGYGYDSADHRTRLTYPAVGGLAAETVTTTYSATGLPSTMVGAEEYVWGAARDDRARPVWLLSGPRATPFSRVFDYDGDQRLARLRSGAGSTTIQDIQFRYDLAFGNVVERNTTLDTQAWRECFDHDDRQRLTRAFTTSGTCAAGTPGTGTNPYNHTYEYSVDGNLTRRVEGATPVAYTYPAAGTARPHAPTAAGAGTYTWNATGDLATRTAGGQTETLTWDAERRLTLVDDPDGDSSFVYDADGARLLRRTPQGATLYIQDHEVTKPSSGSASAVRTYAFGGNQTAIRTTGGVEYLATDNQGSVQLTVPSGGAAPSKVRAYQPYGRPRTADTTATDRGFIGQVEDKATGLNYLNARYYDPGLGRFISPDPLFEIANPQSINPYAYGLNNPAAFSDPSGLIPLECATGEIECQNSGGTWINAPSATSAASQVGAAVGAMIADMQASPSQEGAGTPPLEGSVLDAIRQAYEDLKNGTDVPGIGVCATAASRLLRTSIDGCYLVTAENYGQLVTLSGGRINSDALTLEGLITNAQSLQELEGPGVCLGGGSGGIGGASVTVCASLSEDRETGVLSFRGTVAILPGVSVGPPGAGWWFTMGNTWIAERGATPGVARDVLNGLSWIAQQDYPEMYNSLVEGLADGSIMDAPGEWLADQIPEPEEFECACPTPEGGEPISGELT